MIGNEQLHYSENLDPSTVDSNGNEKNIMKSNFNSSILYNKNDNNNNNSNKLKQDIVLQQLQQQQQVSDKNSNINEETDQIDKDQSSIDTNDNSNVSNVSNGGGKSTRTRRTSESKSKTSKQNKPYSINGNNVDENSDDSKLSTQCYKQIKARQQQLQHDSSSNSSNNNILNSTNTPTTNGSTTNSNNVNDNNPNNYQRNLEMMFGNAESNNPSLPGVYSLAYSRNAYLHLSQSSLMNPNNQNNQSDYSESSPLRHDDDINYSQNNLLSPLTPNTTSSFDFIGVFNGDDEKKPDSNLPSPVDSMNTNGNNENINGDNKNNNYNNMMSVYSNIHTMDMPSGMMATINQSQSNGMVGNGMMNVSYSNNNNFNGYPQQQQNIFNASRMYNVNTNNTNNGQLNMNDLMNSNYSNMMNMNARRDNMSLYNAYGNMYNNGMMGMTTFQQASMQQQQFTQHQLSHPPRKTNPISRNGVRVGNEGIYEASYSNVSVYEYAVNDVSIMRRKADSWVNATHILKSAGLEKGKRTKTLEREVHIGEHEKIQGGYGKYQGTYIPLEAARNLARQYGLDEILRPLFDLMI